MNLADLVGRKDYCYQPINGLIDTDIRSVSGRKMRAVHMAPASSARISQAHKLQSLRNFPRFLDWKIDNSDGGQAVCLQIELIEREAGAERMLLSKTHVRAGEIVTNIELDWPAHICSSSEFDFELVNKSNEYLHLCTCFAFNPRSKLLPLVRGTGVEIGPGRNPKILPSDDVDVTYVESMPAEKWNELYNKQGLEIASDLWPRYKVADARDLNHLEDQSIDFVFSNHVFEHLVNPLQVLENWSRKLREGGLILGVVPDCRFTFDCRQRPSSSSEWLEEYRDQVAEISMAKYLKWCESTAPYNTPQSLIERNYSIHVHYYSPENFSVLAQLARDRGFISSWFLNCSPNNKDFGFVLRR